MQERVMKILRFYHNTLVANHSNKFEGGSIMAIAAASGRLAVLNCVVGDDGRGHTRLYASGDAGYCTLWPAEGNLQAVLSR